jgi:hypothetical protein
MKIWFDADNGPHVLIMYPLVAELTRRGHEVVFTARDRTKTCQLLELYGLSYLKVGAEYGKGMSGKVKGTLGRAWDLARVMRGSGAAVSFGHGSRALPLASRLLRCADRDHVRLRVGQRAPVQPVLPLDPAAVGHHQGALRRGRRRRGQGGQLSGLQGRTLPRGHGPGRFHSGRPRLARRRRQGAAPSAGDHRALSQPRGGDHPRVHPRAAGRRRRRPAGLPAQNRRSAGTAGPRRRCRGHHSQAGLRRPQPGCRHGSCDQRWRDHDP